MKEKVAQAMFRQDHDEAWEAGESATKLIYINNARAALSASCHEELVTALKVYADPEHWQEMTGEFLVHETDGDDRIIWDEGQIARDVLQKVEATDA